MQKSVINLSLRENPSTGFEWSYEITPEGIVELEDEYYSSNQKNSDIQMVGVGGKVVAVFNVIYYQKIRESDFMSCSGLCSLYFQRADGIG